MEENHIRSPLGRFKKDFSQELIEFTDSKEFDKFITIMEQLYLAKLEELQNQKDDKEILVGQRVLNIYSNLPTLMKVLKDEAIQNRRDEQDSKG